MTQDRDRAEQTPLVELLKDVPEDYRGTWPIQWSEDGHETGHAMSPLGLLMHQAAERIEELEQAAKTSEAGSARQPDLERKLDMAEQRLEAAMGQIRVLEGENYNYRSKEIERESAARAQQAEAEPVAWQALMFGEWEHCNNALLRHIDFLPAHLKPAVRPVFATPPAPAPVVPEGVIEVLKQAVEVAYSRSGDVDTEDGCYATTDVDEMIRLEMALCEAFPCGSDDVEPEKMLPQIEALLSSSPQPAGGVPDGWQLMPKELTTEMREAFWKAQDEFENPQGLYGPTAPDHQYASLLSAAPQPQEGES